MRFWWPGSRTPIFLMSLRVGGEGELGAGVERQAAVGGRPRRGDEGASGTWGCVSSSYTGASLPQRAG